MNPIETFNITNKVPHADKLASIINKQVHELGIAIQDLKAFEVNPNMLIDLVAKEDLIFGLARMWEAYAYKTTFETMVFKKMDDAQQWIREKLHKRP